MKRKILIVDDLTANRRILNNMLRADYEVLEAASGAEALKLLEHGGDFVSAVLLDISMPDMNGYEVLDAIRSKETLTSLPVIMITGSEDGRTRVKALTLGANDFVMKPYSSEIIKHCLENNIALREASAAVDVLQRDRLTGVWNRETFFQKAAMEIDTMPEGYFILSCFDIDGFKVINDQYGSETGDAALKCLAAALTAFCEETGGVCGRIYADCFVGLYPAELLAESQTGTQIIEDTIRECTGLELTLSEGRYIVENKSLSVSAMYDRAVIAKNSVKGRFDRRAEVYNEAMRDHIVREREIVGGMKAALRERQFEVWFQPQFNRSTGARIGAEALVRWRHPQKGLIPPGEFIPVFEQNGFIYSLDRFVWEEVCAYLHKWLDEGRTPVPVSVNVSRYDVLRPDVVDFISDLVAKYSLSKDMLRLEITESAFSQSSQHIVDVVRELVDRGFTVEIDDFGSGYSSLNTLKDVPAQIIKLDMKFLQSSSDSQRGGNIVESVVRMAKWLGMSVIAEGVEVTRQADYLHSIGCNYMQGYLYARPMPPEQYESFCRGFGKEERLLTLSTAANLDNNMFWDPESMDTLIFNSFVGGACIYEYHRGKIELLRATEKYAQVIGGAGMTVEDALRLDWTAHFEPRSLERFAAGLRESIAEKSEITGEFLFIDLPGCPHETYLRSAVRVIASAGDRYLVYCTNENITAEKRAEQKLLETDEQLRFLNDMSHELLAQPDVDMGVNAALTKLMTYFCGKRAYIFEFDYKSRSAANTYEVCAEGVLPEMANLGAVPFSLMSFWFDAFERHGFYAIGDIAALGDDRAEERARLLEQDISSLFVVPLRRNGAIIGMIGVDEPTRPMSHVERLIAMGDYIAVMLTRRDLTARIKSDNMALSGMMSDMPGGFVRMRVYPDGSIKPLYFNDGFLKLTGMKLDELMELYGNDPLAGVHADDVPVVKETVEKLLRDGEARSSRYRLRHGNGGYVWITIFGRATRSKNGDVFLNVYYTDMTEQTRGEERQRELLDNLTSGAGLYEYEGGRLSVIYLNKSYWKLVGRAGGDYSGVLPLSAVHPDDMPVIMRELDSAIEQKRDMACIFRLRHETAGYLSVKLTGRIVPAGKGRYSIYTSFAPVSEETESYQQMLPLLLSAMMDSTSDMSFAKGRDFRYLCASRAFANMVGKASENEVIGKTDYDLFEKALADKYRADDEALLKNGTAIIDIVERIPSAGSAPRFSSTSKYILRDGFGGVIGLYGVGRDVTRSFVQDSQLRLVNDSIPGGLASYYCTPGDFSPESIKITYFNDGFCRLFGFTRDEYQSRASVDPVSMVFEEDRHIIAGQWQELMERDVPINCLYRVNMNGGGYKWISHRAVAADRRDGAVAVNAILQDVTDQRELIEQLRISEEENNLAVRLGGSVVCRYVVADRSMTLAKDVAEAHSVPARLENVPYDPVERGMISAETAGAYTAFFEAILGGGKAGTVLFQQRYFGDWRWMEAKSSTIFSDGGKPVKAVISMFDVTERLEKEAVYKKWQQSLADKKSGSYTLYRCNLNRNSSYDTAEGDLITFDFDSAGVDFNERARAYVERCVHAEDKEKYQTVINSDVLLAGYYREKRSDMLEYRELLVGGDYRWLRLTVDLVEYPNSTEVEAYLMYEDIDEVKKSELQTKELSETDPLTGVLNRAAFAAGVDRILRASRAGQRHALLMLDIDGFKQVNDVFGHGTGDRTLIDLANGLSAITRKEDLVCRLGGDEFMVFLNDILDDGAAVVKAKQMCALARKAFSMEVQISGSVGIAISPHDGISFDILYKKVDSALYYVKGSGKDSHAFYNDDMADEHLEPEPDIIDIYGNRKHIKKRRMLIVDDNNIDHELLQNIFRDEFIIEKAKDGSSALIRLRHYGNAISVVLLDLVMPGMDGFAVLERMQNSAELRSIPVLIVSGDESRETCLNAIRRGATDFITKPVDPDILRIRVQSAVSRAENERLRAQNCLLEVQNEERMRYEAAISSMGVALIEFNWLTGEFIYHPSISKYLLGTYDKRMLWQILLSDMVADTKTVQDMQNLVHRIADDRTLMTGSRLVSLKTPRRGIHSFRMNVRKLQNDYQLTNRLLITLTDLDFDGRQQVD